MVSLPISHQKNYRTKQSSLDFALQLVLVEGWYHTNVSQPTKEELQELGVRELLYV